MNAMRRKQPNAIYEKMAELNSWIEEVLEEEQNAYDNMPEALQESERGEAMYNAIDNLESAVSSCEEILEYVEEAAQ